MDGQPEYVMYLVAYCRQRRHNISVNVLQTVVAVYNPPLTINGGVYYLVISLYQPYGEA